MSSSTDESPRPDPAPDGTGVEGVEQRRLVAIGRLAGALAHEFNNHLTAILGYTSLLLDELGDHPARADLLEIRRSGERAAWLTRQLLTFNRGPTSEPQLLSWPTLLDELRPLVRGVLGERVALAVEVGSPPDVIARKADAGHLLFAVALAAADSLGPGGSVTIRVDRRALADGRSGCLVLAQLRDPGATPRVPDAVRAELRACCAAQDAVLELRADAGLAELRIHYLAASEVVEDAAVPVRPLPGRRRRALLAEPDEALRAMLARVLERHGMAVEVVARAEQALERFDVLGEPIDLLVTEATLPGTSGVELAGQVAARWPHARILLLSGHGDAPPPGLGRVGAPVRFLAKPFSGEQLAALLRELTG